MAVRSGLLCQSSPSSNLTLSLSWPNSYGVTIEFEMSVRTGKDQLRKEVDSLLRRRPGWSLQTTATPGAPPLWCFGPRRDIDVTVEVDQDSIRLYLMKAAREVKLASAAELVAWLQGYELASTPLSPSPPEAPPSPRGAVDRPHSPDPTTGSERKVTADDDLLRKQVDELLRHRPGWSLQVTASPGEPPFWSFGSRSGTDMTVEVHRGSICVYLMNSEREVELGTTSDLATWLQDHDPESMQQPQAPNAKRGRFFRWE
jgi:hypothetical protein